VPLAPAGGPRLAAALGRVEVERARVLLGPLLHEPSLLARFDEALAQLAFETPAYERVRDALLDYVAGDGALETEAVLAHLRSVGLAEPAEELVAGHVRLMPTGSTREELEGQYRLRLQRYQWRRSQGAERDLLARALLAGGDDVSRRFESLNSLLNAREDDTAGTE
jgi:hypothetical protein